MGWKVPGGLLGTGRLELFCRGRRRGTGNLANPLDSCIEGVHPGCTKDVSWLSPQMGPGFLGTMEVTDLGHLWEERALSVLFLCPLTSYHSPCGPIRTEGAMLGGPRQGGRAGVVMGLTIAGVGGSIPVPCISLCTFLCSEA